VPRGPRAAHHAAPQPEIEQRQCEDDGRIADQAAGVPQGRQEQTHCGQPDIEQGDGAMAVADNDQPLIEMGTVGGEDVLTIAEAR